MGTGDWGLGTRKRIITNAQCPMPNAQFAILNFNYRLLTNLLSFSIKMNS